MINTMIMIQMIGKSNPSLRRRLPITITPFSSYCHAGPNLSAADTRCPVAYYNIYVNDQPPQREANPN